MEWIAIASVMSFFATLALVIVTYFYVRFTHRLVEATTAGLPVSFDVVLRTYSWVGHPTGTGPEGRLGPFPEQIRIEGTGTRVFIHEVLFDGRRADPLEQHAGAVVGPVRLIDPPPVSLGQGEVVYGVFDGLVPSLESAAQEVGITIGYSLTPQGQREQSTRRVRSSADRPLRWGAAPAR